MKSFYRVLVFLSTILFYTQFNYAQWVQTNGPGYGQINCVAVSGTNIIVGTSAFTSPGIFISSNNGVTWTKSNNGITNTSVNCLTINGSNFFAGTAVGAFISTNNGNDWISLGLSNYKIQSLIINGANILAGTDSSGIYLSTNDGAYWTQINNGLTNYNIHCFAIKGNNIFAGTGSGVFLSTDNGLKWTSVNEGMIINRINSLLINGDKLFAGTFDGAYVSTDNALTWTRIINQGMPYSEVASFAAIDTNIFAGLYGGPGRPSGLYRSSDDGSNWTSLDFFGYDVHAFAINGNNIYAGAFYQEGNDIKGGLFLSTNDGTSWAQVGLPLNTVFSLSIGDNNIFAACAFGNIFSSSNDGTDWTLKDFSSFHLIRCIESKGSNIYAGSSGGGAYHSTDTGSTWTSIGVGSFVNTFATRGNNIYAGSDFGVYISTDYGTSWAQKNNGLTYHFITSFALNGTTIFAGSSFWDGPGDVYISTDNGTTWTSAGLVGLNIYSLAISENSVFAGTGSGGVFRTTNNGKDWTQVNNGLPSNTVVNALTVNGINIFIGTNNGIYLSKDNGTNWTQVGMNDITILCLVANQSDIYAGTDGAAVWKRPLSDFALPVELTSFNASARKDNILLNWNTATEMNNTGFDVERSVDRSEWEMLGFVKGNGNSTSPISYSYVDKSVGKAGKYYYRLKQIDNDGSFKYSNVAEVEYGSPSSFALNQNYPNPFNPSTRISYSLKDKGFVKLKVFDIRGELVKVLVNESKDAGYYEAEFDGKGFASGVYIYRIEVIGEGNRSVYSDVKKTVLLK